MNKLAIIKAVTGCGDRDIKRVKHIGRFFTCAHYEEIGPFCSDRIIRERDVRVSDLEVTSIEVLHDRKVTEVALVAICSECNKVYVEMED